MKKTIAAGIAVLLAGAVVMAQSRRQLSGDGIASAHVLGKWVKTDKESYTLGGEIFQGGKWIDIVYGRPLLRGRDAFPGTGAEYGKVTYAGAPVWRAGANASTRLKTEVPLTIGGKTVPAGEYSLFIELKSPKEWTFIVSSWAAAQKFNEASKDALYGAFEYTPAKDVARAAMKVEAMPFRTEQLTWEFLDVTDAGGRMAVIWDKNMASVAFSVVQ
jgi:Protein of unknown function (DUF2911)